jgi:DHA1 family inner membrane transport protein
MSRTSILALIALAIATFAIGTAELGVLGLLPILAADLDVSIPEAGLLVTGYALGVVVAAPIMAVVTNGIARKSTLLGLMVIFVAGNIFCALAPTYGFLMTARIVTSISHATFFGVASVVATQIVPPDRRASAVAMVFGGVAVATILGVPIGTAIGRAYGWPATFWTVVAIAVTALAAIAAWLPSDIEMERADLRTELAAFRNPQVLLALAVTALTWGSLFVVYTYITPILEEVTRVSEEAVIWVLLIFGVGMTIGNFIGGRLADWRLLPSIVGMIGAVGVVLVILAVVVQSVHLAVVALVAWGILIFALAPVFQFWVVKSAQRAPHLASTVNQMAFHAGAASGAWIGASALSFGIAYRQLPWLGASLTLFALVVAMVTVMLELRRRKAAFARLDAAT